MTNAFERQSYTEGMKIISQHVQVSICLRISYGVRDTDSGMTTH